MSITYCNIKMAVWSVVLWYDVCVVDYVIIIIYMCVFIIRR